MFLRPLIVIALWISTVSMLGAAAMQTDRPWESWVLAKHTGHELTGRIWSVREEAFIEPAKMANELAAANYVLLGEIHDNADHHRLQAWVIAQLTRRGKKPAIVMEMIASDQDKALSAYQDKKDADAAGLGAALAWAKSGWPDWSMYQPIASAAFASGLTIFSANVPRSNIRAIGKKGLGFFNKSRQKELALDKPLDAKMEADLRQLIVEAHCNLLPAAAAGPMVSIQRVRDAVFADKMLKVGASDGAVLIAGSGHVRTDRAVPWYLARRDPGISYKALVLMEAIPEEKNIADYAPQSPDGSIAADYIWFTPMAEREDPCEGLKKHMMKKREKNSKTQ